MAHTYKQGEYTKETARSLKLAILGWFNDGLQHTIDEIALKLNMKRSDLAYRIERYYFYRLLKRAIDKDRLTVFGEKPKRKSYLYSISYRGKRYLKYWVDKSETPESGST